MTSRPALTLADVVRARLAIADLVRRTPLEPSEELSSDVGQRVHLKMEAWQATGSFKIRGAANKILSLPPESRARGVVTVSTGNHGRAVAQVARTLGITAVVCVSERVPENKLRAIRDLGAELEISGDGQDQAEVRATELAHQRGLTLVPPFDDPHVISGQGTIGLELYEDLPSVATLLIPLSGGGLAAGVALAMKSLVPGCRVVGVSMEAAPTMALSLSAGRPVEIAEEPTLADSLQGGIGLDNRHTFPMCRDLLDEFVLVSEGAIAEAMAFALARQGLVLEGAAAVGIAALRHGLVRPSGDTVLVASGRNVDAATLGAVLSHSLPSETAGDAASSPGQGRGRKMPREER